MNKVKSSYKFIIRRKKVWLLRPYRIVILCNDNDKKGWHPLFILRDSAFTLTGAIKLAQMQIQNQIEYDKPDPVVHRSEEIS